MSNQRHAALRQVAENRNTKSEAPKGKISDYFASNVFTEDTMRRHLSDEAFKSVMEAISNGSKIDRNMAAEVASGMKAWAMQKGATHYTHWFQPLTGTTAEKHDSFFSPNGTSGLEKFDASALIQQEPDASSFPSGGLRNTFEARGYTAWDPSSPAFIMEVENGKTLCIPTIFVSYTGESLDYKAPLLKSLQAVEKAAIDVCHYFDRNVNKVMPTLGWEQEYFVIDEALFEQRPDLIATGRTLFGHAPAKGQQLEDHYFGSIPERVYAYMVDFETECFKLGIPLKTRHNEVAPGQYEVAPMFEEVNVAVDHNSLLMDVMDRIARRHKLRVLLHEKPFAGVNGSGKHNNWSMGTDTGKNLLSPGKTPRTNLQFITFFVNTVAAVNNHADLIRASIASASNDFRLGANEAPPAIISVFIGSFMTEVLNEVENRVNGKFTNADKDTLKLDIHDRIPELMMDNTDRNRTSPFAFTGNKFEVRAVGSSQNCASTMIVLNTIVAEQLTKFKAEVDSLVKKGLEKENAILQVLKDLIKESKRICFEGNNYSDEWEKEAKKRGLNNIKTTPTALDAYVTKEAETLFASLNIFTKEELHARHEIELEKYVKKVQIEGRLIGEMAMTQILPEAVAYQNQLVRNIAGLKSAGLDKSAVSSQVEIAKEISEHINGIKQNVDKMTEERRKANEIEDMRKKAIAYCENVKPYFDLIRDHADKLELIVDDKIWSLPKYREMLFIR